MDKKAYIKRKQKLINKFRRCSFCGKDLGKLLVGFAMKNNIMIATGVEMINCEVCGGQHIICVRCEVAACKELGRKRNDLCSKDIPTLFNIKLVREPDDDHKYEWESGASGKVSWRQTQTVV